MTMIAGNALVGHGLEQGEATTQGGTYLATEEAVIAQEEEHIMSQEGTSEDEKMERQMLTVALVKSVVETSKQSPEGNGSEQEAKQRYSLRKRSRNSGEQPLEAPSSAASGSSTKPPEVPIKQEVIPKVEPTKSIQLNPPSQPVIPQPKVKTEAVPACTVAVAAVPLPIPLAASSLPKSSSLPPALQPPRRTSLQAMPPPKATAAAATRPPRLKPAMDKTRRLVPAARVTAHSSQPLTPNPAAIGVPNPLSNPLPASKSILVTKPQNPRTVATSTAAHAFKAGTKLTVPCPLPPSSFQSNVEPKGQGAPPPSAATAPPPATELAPEKKKVTIDLPPQQRGRIFSIDLDPASLDFSVLDSGDSGTPAPASADLPLVTGGGRDRAFSFECFAFGINADEPLPPLADQPAQQHDVSLVQQQDFVTLPRPRGDSIIFDPSSFQEGGIHEENALTTREYRGMSVDLVAAGLLPPSSDSLVATAPGTLHPGQKFLNEHPLPPQAVPSNTALRTTVHPPPQQAPALYMPDTAASNVGVGVAHAPPAAHAPPTHRHAPPPHSHAPHSYHHQATASVPHPVVSSSFGHEAPPGPVSIISSCASSTTLQMELLNKDGRIGIYLPEARKERIARFHAKRKMRIWRKRIKYDCRKKLADSRPRIKGRFVKRTGTD